MKIVNQILLVGSGPMAVEYSKVLKALKKDFIVVGRGEDSAKQFNENTGKMVSTGGLDNFFNKVSTLPECAIVAVSEDQLGKVASKLLEHGIQVILVEKPGGLNFADIKNVNDKSSKTKSKVFIAYNRRFYKSVEKASEIIKEDGGVLSIFFDFTEPDFKIAPLLKAPGVKENWFLQNSTHVVDMAFFLAGAPNTLYTFTAGSLSWHKIGAIFTGAGITSKGALFSYHANWSGPGRWGVELVTKRHKLFFRPLEKLQVQNLGSFEVNDVEIDDSLDVNFKPGLYRQVESFLGNKQNLCTISEQVENLKFYKQILEG